MYLKSEIDKPNNQQSLRCCRLTERNIIISNEKNVSELIIKIMLTDEKK